MVKTLQYIVIFFFISFPIFSQFIDTRLNLNPILDKRYGSTGNIEIQEDQKIIAQGRIDYVGTMRTGGIVRYYESGALDLSYSVGQGFDSRDLDIKLQKDNKLLVWGNFETFNNIELSGGMARLNETGGLDTSFYVSEGIGNGRIRSVDLQSDGKIIIVGYFESFNSEPFFNLVRLNPNGSTDQSFKYAIPFNATVIKVKVLANDKILLAGVSERSTGYTNNVIRLKSDGSLDETFTVGSGTPGVIYDFDILSNGKIIVVGEFEEYNGLARNRIICLNSDGTVDNSFYYDKGADYSITNVFVQKNDQIILMGYFDSYEGLSVHSGIRLFSDGTLDLNYQIGRFISNMPDIAEQSNGKLIFAGDISSYNGVQLSGIARLNDDGSLDSVRFNNSRKASYFHLISTLNKNEFFAVGSFSIIGQDSLLSVAKFSNKTVLDKKFRLNPQLYNTISNATYGIIDANNNMLLSGYVGPYDLLKVDGSGNPDSTFNYQIPSGSDLIYKTYNHNNKYLVHSSRWTSYGENPFKIQRIDLTGSPDPSFQDITVNKSLLALEILTDNKILIGGEFDTLQNAPINTLALINEDGSLNKSYGDLFSKDSKVTALAVDEYQRIYVGGLIVTNKGRKNLVRINTDGSIDETFSFSDERYQYLKHFRLFKDGVIVVGLIENNNTKVVEEMTLLNLDGSHHEYWKTLTFEDVMDHTAYGINSLLVVENSIIIAGNFDEIDNKRIDGLVKIDVPYQTQTITFADIADVKEGSQNVFLVANASSGLPVSFKITNGVATINASTLNLSSAGKISVTAFQEGDSIYWTAKEVSKTFCVSPSVPSIEIVEVANEILLITDGKYNLQWYLDGERVQNATDDTLKVLSTGNYSVSATFDDCNTSSLSIGVTGNEPETDPFNNLTIYPVPATDRIQVKYANGNRSKRVIVYLYNSVGEKVLENELALAGNIWSGDINLQKLKSACYHLVVLDNGNKLSRTISKY